MTKRLSIVDDWSVSGLCKYYGDLEGTKLGFWFLGNEGKDLQRLRLFVHANITASYGEDVMKLIAIDWFEDDGETIHDLVILDSGLLIDLKLTEPAKNVDDALDYIYAIVGEQILEHVSRRIENKITWAWITQDVPENYLYLLGTRYSRGIYRSVYLCRPKILEAVKVVFVPNSDKDTYPIINGDVEETSVGLIFAVDSSIPVENPVRHALSWARRLTDRLKRGK